VAFWKFSCAFADKPRVKCSSAVVLNGSIELSIFITLLRATPRNRDESNITKPYIEYTEDMENACKANAPVSV
jgi:hypothetical protein